MKNPNYGNSFIKGILKLLGYCKKVLLLITFLSTIALLSTVTAQDKKITGTVYSGDTNEALLGVSIAIQGASKGSITDIDGKFSVEIENNNATLVFSFVGFQTKTVKAEANKVLNIFLLPDNKELSELIVVGYAVQKKANLTGSVSSVNSEALKRAPVSNVAQSVMGQLPGLVAKNISGQPGDFNAVKISVRGYGAPLIIIDGMPATNEQFVQLNASEIENVTILKDAASAAVYGARAGNGVVLVTTKRGKTLKPTFDYSGSYGWQSFVNPPEFASSYQVRVMENIARINENLPPLNTDAVLQKYKDGTDPAYPNTNWFDEVFAKNAPQTQHNLSIRGGNDNVRYFVSGGFLSQDGQYKSGDLNYKRYNLRSNIDISLTKKLKLGIDFSVLSSDIASPPYGAGRTNNVQGIYHSILRSQSYYPASFPDATKVPFSGYFNPVAMSNSDLSGTKNTNKVTGDLKINVSYDLPFGFHAKAIIDYNRAYERTKERRREFATYTYDWGTDVYTFRQNNTFSKGGNAKSLTESFAQENNFNQQYFITWDGKFDKHAISALAVYESLSSNWERLSAMRQSYDNDIDYLFAGPDLNKDNSGIAGEDGRKGWIGRLNYAYADKYLLEVNARYDASSRFQEGKQWGLFPSISGAWRISEEGFFKDIQQYVNNLKLRASWGKSGYDNVGQYKYLSLYSIPSSRYIYNINLERGIQSDAISNPNITWEKMTSQNIGIDLGLLNNKFKVEFDYFYRLRTDVLGTRLASQPSIVGATMPSVNYAQYDNRGFELVLTHQNKIGDFAYDISGNITWTREKNILTDQPLYANDELRRQNELNGQWTNRLWGYQALGLFQTQEEIYGWADQDGKNNATILPGDIKYLDYNNDGKIDAADQSIVGRGNTPEVMFGLNINLSWKGLDLSMLWQGATNFNYDLLLVQETFRPFYAESPMWSFWYTDAYTPDNPWTDANTTGYYPRYRSDATSRKHSNWNRRSTYWNQDATYLRLKTIEVGYSLPTAFLKKIGFEKCRFFLSGYNLLTFSKLKIVDPEIELDRTQVPYPGMYYPQTKVINTGITLSF